MDSRAKRLGPTFTELGDTFTLTDADVEIVLAGDLDTVCALLAERAQHRDPGQPPCFFLSAPCKRSEMPPAKTLEWFRTGGISAYGESFGGQVSAHRRVIGTLRPTQDAGCRKPPEDPNRP